MRIILKQSPPKKPSAKLEPSVKLEPSTVKIEQSQAVESDNELEMVKLLPNHSQKPIWIDVNGSLIHY